MGSSLEGRRNALRLTIGIISSMLMPARATPVQQSVEFELVVNRKTATALHLSIPESVRLRADMLIK